MHDIKDIPTKAYVVESKGSPFVLQDVLLDEIQSHEVLVEMLYTGLCHTVRISQNLNCRMSSKYLPGYRCSTRWHACW